MDTEVLDFHVSSLVTSLLKSAVAEQKANTLSAVLPCFTSFVVGAGTGLSCQEKGYDGSNASHIQPTKLFL